MNKFFSLILEIGIFSFIIVSCDFIAYAQVDPENTVDRFVESAIENNTGIKAAYEKWQAALENVKVVSGLPDPHVRYTYFGESIQTRVGPQEHKYGISQSLPFPGKLHLQKKSQEKKAQILKQEYEAAKQQLKKNVKVAYYDLYWVDRALEITSENKTVIEQVEEVAKRRYETKKASQQEVLKAQIELSYLIDKTIQLRQHRKSLVARLNRLIKISNQEILTTGRIEEVPKFNYKPEHLQVMAKELRQEFIVAKLKEEKAELETTLSHFSYAPDITLGVDYIEIGSGTSTRPDDGQDAWMGTIAINLPLWGAKTNSHIREKKKLMRVQHEELQDMRDTLFFEVEDMYYKINAYKETIELYAQALIPQAEQALDTARTGYETGKIEFIDWLDAERTLLKTKLSYHRAVTDYLKSIAFMERITGKDLL